MDKKLAIKLIENEVNVILKEYKIKYVIGHDEGDIIIACPMKTDTQFVYANLKSRYDNKKYWEFTSSIFVKHNYIVHIRLN